MKKGKGLCGFLLTLCVMIGVCLSAEPWHVEAAAGYKKIETNGTAIKAGKYYLKNVGGSICISARKDSGFQKTPIGSFAYSNGSQAFYVRDYVLYKYAYSTRKETPVKKLPAKGAANDPHLSFYISEVYGNQIYLTKGSQGQWRNWTYSYNIKTKKLKKVLSNCKINTRYGKYVIGQNEYRTDVSAYPITLYKVQSSGLKKIKKLSSYGWEPTFAGRKLYYVSGTDSSMKKVTLYHCNLNGSGRRKIKTFSTSQQYGQVLIYNITSKSCEVNKDGKVYRYTYATKKMKRIM